MPKGGWLARLRGEQPARDRHVDPRGLWQEMATETATAATQLAASTVVGRSDAELTRHVRVMGGPASVLNAIVQGMAQQVDPSRAQDCTVAFEITNDGDTAVQTLQIRDGKAKTGVPVDGAEAVLAVSAPDFLRMLAGELDPTAALFEGRLGMRGDTGLLARLSTMFALPG